MTLPRIIVDPDLPPDVRRLLTEWENADVKVEELQDLAPLGDGEDPRRPPLVSVGTWAIVGGGAAAAGVLSALLGWGVVGFFVLLVIPVLAGAWTVLRSLTPRYWHDRTLTARRAHGRYVLTAELDDESRSLLTRTHQAVQTVLRSAAHRGGTLDHIRNEVVLPRIVWEIAAALRGVSDLRARHPHAAGNAGRALAGTVAMIRERVAALETYAEQVTAVDAAVLRPDAHAADDLDALTAQARAATASLRDELPLPGTPAPGGAP